MISEVRGVVILTPRTQESAVADRPNWNVKIIEEFRAHGGRVGGNFEGAPLLLLHSTGARSGEERINPMMYQRVGDAYAVFASKGGAPSNPDWFYNLVAHPEASIEIGDDVEKVTARVAGPAEREPIWRRQKERYRGFADYEQRTDREIPVVILDPVT
jgi:deazaflavin-dependent oxidoreductase (nitroreductase family)